jgi:hypothetical protein
MGACRVGILQFADTSPPTRDVGAAHAGASLLPRILLCKFLKKLERV